MHIRILLHTVLYICRSITLYGLKPFTEYRIVVQGIYSIIVGVSFTNGINTTTTATTAEDCKLLSL